MAVTGVADVSGRISWGGGAESSLPSRALSVELAGLYWHFVDVVWIIIFTLVYLMQAVSGA